MKTAAVVPELPSVTVTSPIESVTGMSSFVMVAVAVARATPAPEAELRVKVKVSLLSMAVSPRTGTATVLLVWPAVKVRVPEVAV